MNPEAHGCLRIGRGRASALAVLAAWRDSFSIPIPIPIPIPTPTPMGEKNIHECHEGRERDE